MGEDEEDRQHEHQGRDACHAQTHRCGVSEGYERFLMSVFGFLVRQQRRCLLDNSGKVMKYGSWLGWKLRSIL